MDRVRHPRPEVLAVQALWARRLSILQLVFRARSRAMLRLSHSPAPTRTSGHTDPVTPRLRPLFRAPACPSGALLIADIRPRLSATGDRARARHLNTSRGHRPHHTAISTQKTHTSSYLDHTALSSHGGRPSVSSVRALGREHEAMRAIITSSDGPHSSTAT